MFYPYLLNAIFTKQLRKLLLCITKAGGEITTEITVLQIVFVKKTTKKHINPKICCFKPTNIYKIYYNSYAYMKLNEENLFFSNKKFYEILLFLHNKMSIFCHFMVLNAN
jgi:hypothetical protein